MTIDSLHPNLYVMEYNGFSSKLRRTLDLTIDDSLTCRNY